MITFFQNLLQNFRKKKKFKNLIITPCIFCRPFCLRDRHAWFTRTCHSGGKIKSLCDIFKSPAYVKYDDVRRDSMINFMLTWDKLSFLIGHFEYEV